MKGIAPAIYPQVRQQVLVIDDLTDEVLVYALDRHKAHPLNVRSIRIARFPTRTCRTKRSLSFGLSCSLRGRCDRGISADCDC
jgi:hypothetical protein